MGATDTGMKVGGSGPWISPGLGGHYPARGGGQSLSGYFRLRVYWRRTHLYSLSSAHLAGRPHPQSPPGSLRLGFGLSFLWLCSPSPAPHVFLGGSAQALSWAISGSGPSPGEDPLTEPPQSPTCCPALFPVRRPLHLGWSSRFWVQLSVHHRPRSAAFSVPGFTSGCGGSTKSGRPVRCRRPRRRFPTRTGPAGSQAPQPPHRPGQARRRRATLCSARRAR